MRILTQPINSFIFDDIVSFCKERHSEGIELDYKREIPPKGLSKHFAAFSNTRGGVIIIGVDEDKNTGVTIAWIGIKNEGKLVDRLHQFASEVQPLPAYDIHVTDEKNGNAFVLVRIFEGDRTPYYVHNDANLWVRTGNISNPIDIASPDHAEILFGKKEKAEKSREIYIKRAHEIFKASVIQAEGERIRLIEKEKVDFEKERKKATDMGLNFNKRFQSQIVQSELGKNISMLTFLAQPFYPKKALISPEALKNALPQIKFGDRRWHEFPSFYPTQMKPIQDGLLNFIWFQHDGYIQCEQLYSNGLVFYSLDVLRQDQNGRSEIKLLWVAAYFFIFLNVLKNFYRVLNYQGGVIGSIQLENTRGIFIKPIEAANWRYHDDYKEGLLNKYRWDLELDTSLLNSSLSLQNYFVEKIKEIYWSLGYEPASDKLYEDFFKENGWFVELNSI